MEEKKLTLEEFRAQRAEEAAAHGHTLEEEMDDLERLTRSKEYADAMRELYGISVTPA
jgi:hypothetical protein